MAAMRRLVCNFQQKLIVGKSLAPVRLTFNSSAIKCFSTTPLSGEVHVGNEVVSIPSNLKVFDASILSPVPEPEVKIQDYLFPLLNVPSSMDVVQFKNPNEKVAPVPLVRTIFEVAIRKDIVLTLVRYIRNQRRQPKKTKRMSEISGSNKKPRPQKGTGTGQVGHHRNSAWRKGQKAHGPVIRDYSINMNKKQRALGMMMVLAAKFREGNLHVVDSFDVDSHRTKEFRQLLAGHGLDDKLSLFVEEGLTEKFSLASGNLPKVESKELRHLNAYDVLRKEKLVMTVNAFTTLQEKLLFQYTQSGKRFALSRASQMYYDMVKEGEALLSEQQQS